MFAQMFEPLPVPKEMGTWDNLSIKEFGIHGEILMENASREALHVLQSRINNLQGKEIILFAGSGNNGGDAMALARHLNDCGARCLVLHTRDLDKYTGETAYHLNLARKSQIDFIHLGEFNLDQLSTPDIIVDGLLGTGFQGQLKEDYLYIIQYINKLREKAFVLSLDIPSGVNGETGQVGTTAVKAHCTVTFGAAKLGLFLPEAQDYVGELCTRSIGIPVSVARDNPPSCFGLNQNIFQVLEPLHNRHHKGRAGHTLVLGGSPGLSGAPVLAALGAIRTGSGLTTIGYPGALQAEMQHAWPDIMTLPLGKETEWNRECYSLLQEHLPRFDSVVLGPGLGRNKGCLEFLQAYLGSEHMTTVLDADALFALAQDKSLLAKLREDCVLTPHPGEMSRLCDTSTAKVQADRKAMVEKLISQTGCTLVLKGAGSIVSSASQPLFISPFATPNLAVGGSGDVLAGIIGSLMARGIAPLQASCLGVYWHGLAGEYLRKSYPWRGNLAQDIAHCLPRILDKEKHILE